MFRWINRWVAHNFWLKFVALFLAVISWFYINDEIRSRSSVKLPSVLSRFVKSDPVISKKVSISANLKGKPARGYSVHYEEVTVMPATCVVWGRESIINKINGVYTEPINIDKKTESLIVHTQLKSVPDIVLPESKIVRIEIPIVSDE